MIEQEIKTDRLSLKSMILIAKILSLIRNWLSGSPSPHQVRISMTVWRPQSIIAPYSSQETAPAEAPPPKAISNRWFEKSPNCLLAHLQPTKSHQIYLKTNWRVPPFPKLPPEQNTCQSKTIPVSHLFTFWNSLPCETLNSCWNEGDSNFPCHHLQMSRLC